MADQVFNAVCGFFDAIDHDRTYTADDMNRPYSRVISDGVFATNEGTPSRDLKVVSTGSGMRVTVQAGQGIFAHKWFELTTPVIITVPSNLSLYSRVDSVIAQIDKRATGRAGNIVYRTGTPAATPQAPEINTDAHVIEYRVANVRVAPGANTITNAVITDLRGSDSCPWVTGLIRQVDTSTLWTQFNTAYAEQYEAYDAEYRAYTAQQHQAWEDFLEHLTDELAVETNITELTSSYTAEGQVSNVPIGIPAFNPLTDVLQVYINGLFAEAGVKYNIGADNISIDLASPIAAGNTVYFVVYKSLVDANIESTVSMMLRLNDNLDNFMSDSGWIPLELEDGTQPYTEDTAPAVRKIGNRVYLRGAITNQITTGATICTIPVAFRPAQDYTFTSSAESGTGTVVRVVTLTVRAADGAVVMESKGGTIAATTKISIAANFLAAAGYGMQMIYFYKGSVDEYADLPTSGVEPGEIYTVLTADAGHGIAAGDDVLWNGAEWELSTETISETEIDEIIASF